MGSTMKLKLKEELSGLSCTNDGHSVKVTVDESVGAGISGSPLSDAYTLAQFHLHWGSTSGQGQFYFYIYNPAF